MSNLNDLCNTLDNISGDNNESSFNFEELKSKIESKLKANDEFWNLSVLVYYTRDVYGNLRYSQEEELSDLIRKYHKFDDGDDEARFWMVWHEWLELSDPQCDRDGFSSATISEFEAYYNRYKDKIAGEELL